MSTNQDILEILYDDLIEFKGLNNSDSYCWLTLYKGNTGKYLAVISSVEGELAEEHNLPVHQGTSITNSREIVGRLVVERWQIPLANLIWIEHYPKDKNRSVFPITESMEIISFEIINGQLCLANQDIRPDSIPISKAEFEKILGNL